MRRSRRCRLVSGRPSEQGRRSRPESIDVDLVARLFDHRATAGTRHARPAAVPSRASRRRPLAAILTLSVIVAACTPASVPAGSPAPTEEARQPAQASGFVAPRHLRSVSVVGSTIAASGNFRGTGKSTQIALLQDALKNMSLRIAVREMSPDTNTFSESEWLKTPPDFFALGRAKVVVADVDADGKDDLVALYADGETRSRLLVLRSTGSSFLPPETWWTSDDYAWNRARNILSGDLTGTGRDSLAVIYQYDGFQMRVHLFEPKGSAFAFGGAQGIYDSGVGQFDASRARFAVGHFTRSNGADQIASFYQYPNARVRLSVFDPTPSGMTLMSNVFETADGDYDLGRASIAAADVTGDGADDARWGSGSRRPCRRELDRAGGRDRGAQQRPAQCRHTFRGHVDARGHAVPEMAAHRSPAGRRCADAQAAVCEDRQQPNRASALRDQSGRPGVRVARRRTDDTPGGGLPVASAGRDRVRAQRPHDRPADPPEPRRRHGVFGRWPRGAHGSALRRRRRAAVRRSLARLWLGLPRAVPSGAIQLLHDVPGVARRGRGRAARRRAGDGPGVGLRARVVEGSAGGRIRRQRRGELALSAVSRGLRRPLRLRPGVPCVRALRQRRSRGRRGQRRSRRRPQRRGHPHRGALHRRVGSRSGRIAEARHAAHRHRSRPRLPRRAARRGHLVAPRHL